MIIAALSSIAKKWNQLICPAGDGKYRTDVEFKAAWKRAPDSLQIILAKYIKTASMPLQSLNAAQRQMKEIFGF